MSKSLLVFLLILLLFPALSKAEGQTAAQTNAGIITQNPIGNQDPPEQEDTDNDLGKEVHSCIYSSHKDIADSTGEYHDIVFMQEAEGFGPYRLSYMPQALPYKFIKNKPTKESWGIAYNDSLYLNCLPLTGIYSFAKAHTRGKYLLFFAEIPFKRSKKTELAISESTAKKLQKLQFNPIILGAGLGFLGGIIGVSVAKGIGSAIASHNPGIIFIPIVMETDTNVSRAVSKSFMDELRSAYPDIAQPEALKDEEFSDKELIEYFTLLNDYAAGMLR